MVWVSISSYDLATLDIRMCHQIGDVADRPDCDPALFKINQVLCHCPLGKKRTNDGLELYAVLHPIGLVRNADL